MSQPEPSRLEQIYPNVVDALNLKAKLLHEVIENCLFVVDTNTLLVPYKAKTESLAGIQKLYKRLASSERLFIPEHVLREFFQNQPKYHDDVYKELHKAVSNHDFTPTNVSALDNDDVYKNLKECEAKIKELYKDRKRYLNELKAKASTWYCNDPVLDVYKNLFTKEQIITHGLTNDDIKKELGRRNSLGQTH